jgi:peptidoglycan/LPS O-acetylase OafA/YrhL
MGERSWSLVPVRRYGGVLLLVLPELSARARNEGVVGGLIDRLLAILAFVGSYSYAIYLWHAPAASGGMHLVGRLAAGRLPNVVLFGVYVAMSVALGAIMTKVVEVPVLRWRDRLWPPRGTVS